MNNTHILIASQYLVKRAFANYLGMGGAIPGTGSNSGALPNMGTHNLGTNTSNVVSGTKPPPDPTSLEFNMPYVKSKPALTSAPAASGQPDFNASFKKYMGSEFDPNSKTDQAKMQYMQGLHNKGVTLNAANIYDKAQGYGKF